MVINVFLEATYDLHQTHKNSPIIDTETIPYIPIRWSNQENQIPETFQIDNSQGFYCPIFQQYGTCNMKGCAFVHSKKPKQKKFINTKIKYCHSFANTGICNAAEVNNCLTNQHKKLTNILV